jgi:hypothetical protein
MLAGVLLHVIEAARPVDLAADDVARVQRAGHDVRDRAVVTIDDIGDRRTADRSGVERLSARCRIERSLIEGDFRCPATTSTATTVASNARR